MIERERMSPERRGRVPTRRRMDRCVRYLGSLARTSNGWMCGCNMCVYYGESDDAIVVEVGGRLPMAAKIGDRRPCEPTIRILASPIRPSLMAKSDARLHKCESEAGRPSKFASIERRPRHVGRDCFLFRATKRLCPLKGVGVR